MIHWPLLQFTFGGLPARTDAARNKTVLDGLGGPSYGPSYVFCSVEVQLGDDLRICAVVKRISREGNRRFEAARRVNTAPGEAAPQI